MTLLKHCADIYFNAIRSPLCFSTDNKCVLNVFYARSLNTDEGMPPPPPGVRLNRGSTALHVVPFPWDTVLRSFFFLRMQIPFKVSMTLLVGIGRS